MMRYSRRFATTQRTLRLCQPRIDCQHALCFKARPLAARGNKTYGFDVQYIQYKSLHGYFVDDVL